MIHVLLDTKIIFVRGVYKMSAIEEAVLEAIDRKRWINRGEWTIVGLADDNSRGMETALPFSPPQEDRNPVGFKL
jgi:hypothetical protein